MVHIPSGAERRQWKRHKCTIPAVYRIVSGRDRAVMSRRLKCTVEDISVAGVRIKVSNTEADGLHISGQLHGQGWVANKVEIEFEMPTSPPEKITFLGLVEWYDREQGAKEVSLGVSVRYLEMSEGDKENLMKFLAT